MNHTIFRQGERTKMIDRTRRTSKTLHGFDYALGKPVERTTQEWRQQLHRLVAQNGYVEHHDGETWGRRRTGEKQRPSVIEFEIYGYIK